MQTLPGDALRYLASYLSNCDLFNLILSCQQNKMALYDNETVWRPRVLQQLTEDPKRSQMPLATARRLLLNPWKLSLEQKVEYGCEKVIYSIMNSFIPSSFIYYDSLIEIRNVAIQYGHLDIFEKYLPIDFFDCFHPYIKRAIKYGHAHIVARFLPQFDRSCCSIALMETTEAYTEDAAERVLEYLFSEEARKYVTEEAIRVAVNEVPFHRCPTPYYKNLLKRVEKRGK